MLHIIQNIRINRINKYLLYILLILLILIPGILFSKLQITDDFLYQVIGAVKYSLNNPFLFNTNYYGIHALEDFAPGYPTIIILITKVTNIDPEKLMFFPIGMIVLIISIFSLIKKFFNSTSLAFFFSFYSSYELSLLNHYNIFAYSWNYPLYILFISILIDLNSNKKWQSILLILILFFGAYQIHYNVPIWMITAILILSLNSYIRLKILDNKDYNQYWSLFLTLIIIYLSFNKVFYNVWLPNLQISDTMDYINMFINQILAHFLTQSTTIEKFQLLNQWNVYISLLRLVTIVLILIPILIGLIISIKYIIFNKKLFISDPIPQLIIQVGLVTAFVDMMIYGNYSGFNVKYITFFLPIISIIFLNKFNIKFSYKHIYIVLILVTIFLTFGLTIQHYDKYPFPNTKQFEPSKEWFYTNINSNVNVLADVNTAGNFLIIPNNYNFTIKPIYFDIYNYESIVNNSDIYNPNFKYLLIDSKSKDYMPIHGVSNKLYEPIGSYLVYINNNDYLGKIYDDSLIYIYSSLKVYRT